MSDDEPEGLEGFDVVADDPLPDAPPEADARIQPFVDPPLELCPVVPLGFEGARVVFAMPEGEIRKELAAKIGQMLRADIFVCAKGQAFLTNWRNKKNEFQREWATVWFNRKCRDAGQWDSARPMRSLGVWPGEAGQVVLHLGDEIRRYAGKGKPETLSIIEALRERRGPLYRLRPPAPRPGKACSSQDGQWARDQLDLWRFEAIGGDGLTGADVVAGWLMAALLGAVAPFRGHLLVNAMAGSGKSALVGFIHALQSALAGDVVDSFTEAGLRNSLSGEARPVLLDEAEGAPGTHGPGAAERALELLRRMSTGSGGTRLQGDVGGGSVTQTAVGAVLMAAINPPKLGSADGSRMVEVRLLPLSGTDLAADAARPRVVSRAELMAAVAKARALGPALLGRALAGAGRYLADVDEMSAALGRGRHDPRTGDLIAMLAAGRRLLLFDQPLTPQEADEEAAFWAPLLVEREEAEVVSNPGAEALAHLMAADVGLQIHGRRETLGGLINRWSRGEREYDDDLRRHGVMIWDGEGPGKRPGPWLLVANHHPKLVAIFANTRWSSWRKSLGYLDNLGPEHKTWSAKPRNYGVGNKQRAIAIPLAPWLDRISGRSATVPASVPGQDDDWAE